MIGYCNIDIYLAKELSNNFHTIMFGKSPKDFPKLGGLVIDWVKKGDENFLVQAAIVEHYSREGIPIVIFDRYMSMTGQEYSWLKKFNTHFFEPALNYRDGFEYLPQWMPINNGIKIEEKQYNFDIGYIGSLENKVKQFEKYYRDYIRIYTNRKIFFYTENKIPIEKMEDWKREGLFNSIDIKYDFNFTILIESNKNIEIGYIRNDLYYLLKNNILPLLPREHKYFNCLFGKLCIENLKDIEYLATSFKDPGIRSAVIDDIFNDIRMFYPEFTLEYAFDKIRRRLI